MPDDSRVAKIIKDWRRAATAKSKWDHHFDDLARVLLPRREGFATTTIEGERRTDDIFDGTPMQAARGLANAVGGMLRPQGLPEVEMKAEDDELNDLGEAQDWLGDSEEKLKKAFDNPKARFRQASGQKDLDVVVFGTAVMFIGEPPSRNRLLFQSVHLKEASILFNDEQRPETLYRRRMMPLRHLEALFGRNALSPTSAENIKENPDERTPVLHAVRPRKNGRAEALFARDLPFEDLWIEINAKHILSEGGFHEFPFIVPRWDTSSGEDYGRGPGMIALPDADTLQAMGETILIAGQRAADPALAVPNDGTFDAINTFPGGVTYYDVETAIAVRGNPFFTIPSGTNLPISRDMQLDTRQQVWAAFFRNVLNLPVGGPQMTATEVIQRKEEFIREMGPIFGRFESDDTAPTVERAFMIQLRAGGFLPIPKALQGRNVIFEYDSPVKRIRQQVEAAAARLWAEETMVLAQTQAGLGMEPTAADLPNVDELARFSAEALGIPGKLVNTQETVTAIREQRQQRAEEEREMAVIQQAAELAKTGAEAVSTVAGSGQQGVE